MPDVSRARYSATLITPAFEIVGQLEPVGPWLDWLNSKDKFTLPIYNARFMPLGAAQASGAERPQIFVYRSDICLIYLPDPASHAAISMLKNMQSAVSHIGPVVCRGEWHMGVDASLSTFIDDLPGIFFPITHADLHSKVQLPVALPAKADVIIANRTHVAVYHPA